MATPIFGCGFECGVIAASAVGAPHWRTAPAGTAPTIDTVVKRFGLRSLKTASGAVESYVISSQLSGGGTRFIVRGYIRFDTLPSGDVSLAGDTTGPNLRFRNVDSSLYAAVGTTRGATGVVVSAGLWYLIDLDMNINTGGNDLCDAKVNGVALGQATAAGLSTTILGINLGKMQAVAGAVYFDDVWISATAADYPLGAGKVLGYSLTSDGTHNIAGANDFEVGTTGVDILNSTTTAWQLARKIPISAAVDGGSFINCVAPPASTQYVECLFEDTAEPVAPRSIEALIARHESGTTVGAFQLHLRDAAGGTTAIMVNFLAAGSVTLVYHRAHYALIVGSASPWTLTAFNALRMRFGFSSDASPDQGLDGILIEAEFADASGAIPVSVVAGAFSVVAPVVAGGAITEIATEIAATFAAIAPTILRVATIAPAATAMAASVQAPTVVPGNVTITPAAVAMAGSVIAPTVVPGATTVVVAEAAAAFSAPSITIAAPLTVPVAEVAMVASVIAPAVVPVLVLPVTEVAASFSVVAATLLGGSSPTQTITPDAVAMAASVIDPAIAATITVTAAEVVATFDAIAPTTGGALTVEITAPIAAAFSAQAVATTGALTLQPAAVAATFSEAPDRTIASPRIIVVAEVTMGATVAAPVVVPVISIVAVEVAASFAVVAPAVISPGAPQTVTPTAVAMSASVQAPDVLQGAVAVAVAEVAMVASVIAPALTAAITIAADAVAMTASAQAAVVVPGSAIVTVAEVAAALSVQAATCSATGALQTLTPDAVAMTGTVAAPVILSPITLTVGAVTLTASAGTAVLVPGAAVIAAAAVTATFGVVAFVDIPITLLSASYAPTLTVSASYTSVLAVSASYNTTVTLGAVYAPVLTGDAEYAPVEALSGRIG